MSTWTAGYRADVGYSYGYYAEMNPLRLQLVFLNAGLLPPVVGAACELGFGQILEVVMVLMGMGVLAPAQDETVVAKVKKHTDRLNTYLMSKVRSNNDLKFLVSPVTGRHSGGAL